MTYPWAAHERLNAADLNAAIAAAADAMSPAGFSAAMLTWFTSLPTTLPATSGVLWNNGGMISLS